MVAIDIYGKSSYLGWIYGGIIQEIYNSDLYAIAATSAAELLETIINGFQSLSFVIGVFVWDLLAVSDPPRLLYFLL